jgi:hypothetical protein
MKTDVNMINTKFIIKRFLITTTDYKKPTAVTMFSSVASYALHTPWYTKNPLPNFHADFFLPGYEFSTFQKIDPQLNYYFKIRPTVELNFNCGSNF